MKSITDVAQERVSALTTVEKHGMPRREARRWRARRAKGRAPALIANEYRYLSNSELWGGSTGAFDRRVFRAIETIVLSRVITKEIPLQHCEPVDVRDVLNLLRLDVGSTSERRVRSALRRLHTFAAEETGVSQPDEARSVEPPLLSYLSGNRRPFRLSEEVLLHSRGIRVRFSSSYMKAVESGSLCPLDWDLWLSLAAHPRAQRLYEILLARSMEEKGAHRLSFPFMELCRRIPMNAGKGPAQAMVALDPIHEVLQGIRVKRDGGIKPARLIDRVGWSWDGRETHVQYVLEAGHAEHLRRWRPPAVRRIESANATPLQRGGSI